MTNDQFKMNASSWLLSGLIATVGIWVGWVPSAIAQTTSTDLDPLEDLRTEDDSAGGLLDGADNSSGIFELYHRLNLSGGQTSEQFSNRQQENLGEAAADFRERQRQQLQNSPDTSEPTNMPQ
jgi:hypothetical protein